MGPAAISEQKKYKCTQKYISTKVLITQPFFELQTPDFAWKFIWTVEPNNKVQKYKNTKVQSTKQKSTKIQKRKKNTRKCKKCKKHKIQKYKALERQLLAQWQSTKVKKYKSKKNT